MVTGAKELHPKTRDITLAEDPDPDEERSQLSTSRMINIQVRCL